MFTSHDILARYAPVDLRNPINRAHPLNRGRVAWWMALPGWYGGNKFYDLCGLNHGMLTNMDSASGWRGTTRSGGWGHVQFAGGGTYVSANTVPDLTTFTLAAWVNSAAVGTAQICTRTDLSGYNWYFRPGGNSGFRVSGGGAFREITCTAPAANSWGRCVLTYDGTTLTYYLNGVLAVSAAKAGPPSGGSSYTTTIGQQASTGGDPYTGSLDDVLVWSRPLTAAEVWQDYDLSRRGYPGVLNRVPLFYIKIASTLNQGFHVGSYW